MRALRVELELLGPLGSPLRAETLFGHVCWGIAHSDGDAGVEDFLGRYENGCPPLVLAHPFPQGNLPMPVTPNPAPAERRRLVDQFQRAPSDHWAGSGDSQQRDIPPIVRVNDAIKRMGKAAWLPSSSLKTRFGNLDATSRHEILMEAGIPQTGETMAVVPHVALNRLTLHAQEEGGLFFTEERFHAGHPRFDWYVWGADDVELSTVEGWLVDGLRHGYGRDKSVGKGRLAVRGIEQADWPDVDDANAVLLLGPCWPAPADPTRGFIRWHTHYGKLGGDWAAGPGPDGVHDPFKKPVTVLDAGTILMTDQPRPYYGRLVSGIHRFPAVRHYAIAPAVAIRWTGEEV